MQQIETAMSLYPPAETIAERLLLRCILLECFIQVTARIARIPGSDDVRSRSRRLWTGGQQRLDDPTESFQSAMRLLLRYADDVTDKPLHERARRWLDANWNSRTPLRRMAADLGADERTLTRHFRAAVGVTLKEYQRQLQLARGVQLLRETNIKVEAIALLIGCQSKTTFYRMLRKTTGQRPADIRRSSNQC